MTYTLYSYARSGGAMVEAALAEIGVACEIQKVDLRSDEQRAPAYLAVNPHGKVPALVTPEGDLLTETLAILLTLDERHPEAGLLPLPGSAERANALRWLAFAATELYPVVEILDYPARFAPSADAAAATRAVALGIWRDRLHTMEDQLPGNAPYLLGDRCSLTDIYWSVITRWGRQPGWTAEHTPKLERQFHAVAARPRIAAVWGDRWRV